MVEQTKAGPTKETLFKRPLSRTEAKSAETDKAAKQILKDEQAALDVKNARLRAARMKREQSERP